jgi:hypothetical protein
MFVRCTTAASGAWTDLANRVLGKPKKAVDVTSSDGSLTIIHWADDLDDCPQRSGSQQPSSEGSAARADLRRDEHTEITPHAVAGGDDRD